MGRERGPGCLHPLPDGRSGIDIEWSSVLVCETIERDLFHTE